MNSRRNPALLMKIERSSDTPLFQQVYLQLRSSILLQRLQQGTKLPSTRALAQDLNVSRSLVVLAYEQLLAEGCVSGKIGSGTYVASGVAELAATRPVKTRKRSTKLPRSVPPGSPDVTEQLDDRPFNLGRTLLDARTVEHWRKLSARTFELQTGRCWDIRTREEARSCVRLFATTCVPRVQSSVSPSRSLSPPAHSTPSTSLFGSFNEPEKRKFGSKIQAIR